MSDPLSAHGDVVKTTAEERKSEPEDSSSGTSMNTSETDSFSSSSLGKIVIYFKHSSIIFMNVILIHSYFQLFLF